MEKAVEDKDVSTSHDSKTNSLFFAKVDQIQLPAPNPTLTESAATFAGLVIASPGFDIEIGSKDQPKIEDTSTKTLVDSDKNTPYYSHYFKPKRKFFLSKSR
jgi:hypothetical protein